MSLSRSALKTLLFCNVFIFLDVARFWLQEVSSDHCDPVLPLEESLRLYRRFGGPQMLLSRDAEP